MVIIHVYNSDICDSRFQEKKLTFVINTAMTLQIGRRKMRKLHTIPTVFRLAIKIFDVYCALSQSFISNPSTPLVVSRRKLNFVFIAVSRLQFKLLICCYSHIRNEPSSPGQLS